MRQIDCLGRAAGILWIAGTMAIAQQAPGGGVGPAGGQGQSRGIRAVTRRTLMSGYGADPQAMIGAPGAAGFQGAATLPGVASAPAATAPTPILASNPALQRRDVQAALQRFAASGDAQAAAALAESRMPTGTPPR